MRRCDHIKDPAAWLRTTIESFVRKSPENSLKNKENEKAWADPLVGFSGGDDPLYQFFKEDIGDFYWTPLDIFGKTFPFLAFKRDQLTVIAWVLPQTEATKLSNREQTVHPSESWARARIYGEEVNDKIRRLVVATLHEQGFAAVAPLLSPLWEGKLSQRCGFASTWSERHAAYASGLGTFGLCDGLITPRGKAMRCGSVVANIKIPPSSRPYNDHHAYCLFFSGGICGKCIQRCPAGAITTAGHDKEKCREYLHSVTADYVRHNYGFNGYACGLCQTGVPCESKIPTEHDI